MLTKLELNLTQIKMNFPHHIQISHPISSNPYQNGLFSSTLFLYLFQILTIQKALYHHASTTISPVSAAARISSGCTPPASLYVPSIALGCPNAFKAKCAAF